MIGVFLDFSKAFDQGIILAKLNKLWVRDKALLWSEDYFTNRMHYVAHNFINSEHKMIDCGVPQGSILGPILSSPT